LHVRSQIHLLELNCIFMQGSHWSPNYNPPSALSKGLPKSSCFNWEIQDDAWKNIYTKITKKYQKKHWE
jgi:hypothetical protein